MGLFRCVLKVESTSVGVQLYEDEKILQLTGKME